MTEYQGYFPREYNLTKDIIEPLDNYLLGVISENEVDWSQMRFTERHFKEMNPTRTQTFMEPYFRKLIEGDDGFFRNKISDFHAKSAMITMLKYEGRNFCHRFSNIDIAKAAETWGRHMMKDNHSPALFIQLLIVMTENGYSPNWDKLYLDVRQKLQNSMNYGNYKTQEMLCILMAVIMIMKAVPSLGGRRMYLEQMDSNWFFLRYLYSVMIHYIIGVRLDNFAALANTMCARKSDYAHMHLFYRAFKENFDTICPDGLKDKRTGELVRTQALYHLEKIEEIITQTEPCNDLNQLCAILFPRKFQQVLKQQRPKTYRELESDIVNLTQSYEELAQKMATMIELQLGACTSEVSDEKEAITAGELSDSFKRFPTQLALALFGSVATLLAHLPSWQHIAPAIQAELLSHQADHNISIANNYGPLNGNIQQQTLEIPAPINQPKIENKNERTRN